MVPHVKWSIIGSALLSVSTAHAQVYEIAPEGTVMVRDGGGAVVWHAPEARSERPAAAAPVSPPPADLSEAVARAAGRHRISPDLLEALVWQESRWHANAVSPKGARGLTQLMPDTARTLGVDPRDPVANLDGGAHYLRQLLDRFGGDVELALAAYNAGPGRVERAGSVPAIAETRNYVASIMDRLGNHALATCAKTRNCTEAVP
jgi:soluble lytic murein transglycosylase-like protein